MLRQRRVTERNDGYEGQPRKREQIPVPWVILILFVPCLLAGVAFFYSFAAWKLDAKRQFEWSEYELSVVFALGNIGQNFVVHMGYFYDTQGAVRSCLCGALLKVGGHLGMWWLSTLSQPSAWAFGCFLFLDTQATSLIIMLAQYEAQKATPTVLSGTVASVCTAAFSAGATGWVAMYDTFFAPSLRALLLCQGLLATVLLMISAIVLPLLTDRIGVYKERCGTNRVTKNTINKSSGPLLQSVLRSHSFIAFFLCVGVMWGVPLVWIANAASFSTAAGLQNGASIRAAFFTMGSIGRVIMGPLSDAMPLPNEVWMTACAFGAAFSSMGMLVTGGMSMYPLAALTGFFFGLACTLVPMHCKKIDMHNAGTIYAISKVGALICSQGWIFLAGYGSQRSTPVGQNNCIGPDCYWLCWISILIVSVPICVTLLPWAARALKSS